MITFKKACNLIEKNVLKTKIEETKEIENSYLRVISKDYISNDVSLALFVDRCLYLFY